jgi:HEAT repeat protein
MGADAKVALPDLESCMMSDTDSAVRGWCAQAMGKIGSGDPEMIAKFASLLKSPDAQMRVHGVTALAEMPRESVRPFLESVLDDENETVRVQAEKALGLID